MSMSKGKVAEENELLIFCRFIREYDLFVRNNDDDTKAKMLNLFQLTEEYKKRLRGISK